MGRGTFALVVGWAIGWSVAACSGADSFGCQSDESCSGGECREGFCAFPDADCESGLRWSDVSQEFSGMCVPPPAGTGTSGPTTAGDTSVPPTDGSSSGGPAVATGSSGNVDGTSTGEGPSTTTGVDDTEGSDSTGSAPLHPDLVGWWRLDDGMGTEALDSGPLANTGTVSGGATWAAGYLDGALAFDGTDGEIAVSAVPDYDLTDAITLAAWVYVVAPAPEPHPGIISRNTSYDLRLNGTGTNIDFLIHAPDVDEANAFGNVSCYGSELPLNTWVHVAGTYDVADRTLRVYVGGAEVCALTLNGGMGNIVPVATADVFIGRRGVTDGAQFNGSIDDARIYRAALAPDEIAALAAAQ